jgi:spermidine dehydrogenase
MPHITRRDFFNGMALTVAVGLTPAAQLAAKSLQRYPPALTGMRGHHDGSFEVAHALRDGNAPAIGNLAVAERYDLVVVGGGISGLAAAWFYRKANPSARILILDNHDDFGGHARRNEFTINRRLILSYGGSESLQSPKAFFSPVVNGLMRELGVDIARFETAFERKLYPSLGLSRGVFFPRETFGRDTLVTGDPQAMVADDLGPGLLNAKPLRDFVAGFPVSAEGKAQLVDLYEQSRDPLAGKSAEEKKELLENTSYADYLSKICGCRDEVVKCFYGRTLDFTGLSIEQVSAAFAREMGMPGFGGLGLPDVDSAERSEPYIYHFPDGNASIARLLVRSLIPGIARGNSMDDIVQARFDYDRLDRADQRVRIRLDSMAVNVRNAGQGVDVTYIRAGKPYRVQGKHAILAGFNMMIPYIMPDLPPEQARALQDNIKAPLVYTKVLTRNWKPWVALGVHEISAPMSFHCRVKLDYPVSLGRYRHPRDPSEPMCLHLVHVPNDSNPGLDARSQFRIGRMKLLEMTFADFEKNIRSDLDRMLGPGGFSSARDIAAITVNRWSHGYSYAVNSLFDEPGYKDIVRRARQPIGRVAIANSDADWEPYLHAAIDQAERAVREVLQT